MVTDNEVVCRAVFTAAGVTVAIGVGRGEGLGLIEAPGVATGGAAISEAAGSGTSLFSVILNRGLVAYAISFLQLLQAI